MVLCYVTRRWQGLNENARSSDFQFHASSAPLLCPTGEVWASRQNLAITYWTLKGRQQTFGYKEHLGVAETQESAEESRGKLVR